MPGFTVSPCQQVTTKNQRPPLPPQSPPRAWGEPKKSGDREPGLTRNSMSGRMVSGPTNSTEFQTNEAGTFLLYSNLWIKSCTHCSMIPLISCCSLRQVSQSSAVRRA